MLVPRYYKDLLHQRHFDWSPWISRTFMESLILLNMATNFTASRCSRASTIFLKRTLTCKNIRNIFYTSTFFQLWLTCRSLWQWFSIAFLVFWFLFFFFTNFNLNLLTSWRNPLPNLPLCPCERHYLFWKKSLPVPEHRLCKYLSLTPP